MTAFSEFDRHMMSIALAMARRGLGTTAYNPSVGAVIADEASGEVVSRGWTQPGGRPHAEKEALRRAGARARGKTMYVSLEPCAHTGRVPTCADAVAAAGLKRLVCAISDPNPVIAGSGLDQLRASGVQVDLGLHADAARWVAAGHVLSRTLGRPFVQMKLAVSADGRIASGTGRPVWVTGDVARADGHHLRATADAIVVGIGTVLADDPELTCRLPGLAHRSPMRIVVDRRLRLPPTARVLATGPSHASSRVLVAAASAPDTARYDALIAAGALIMTDLATGTAAEPRIALGRLLDHLLSHNVRRVLVEGGPALWQSFLAADLVDEVVLYRGAEPVSGPALEPLERGGLAVFDSPAWMLSDERPLGRDTVSRYRRARRL
jgi:diaminohydroxyphosphoribosylaminopyrimidine deaminase/5-amino-6-(5-phosphoribosylamino)uracil reductase